MARSRRAFCLKLGAAVAAAVFAIHSSAIAAIIIPNLTCSLTGTPLAPGAKATATLKLVNKQPTFQITGDTFTPFANKTLTLQIVRDKTKILLTRVQVDGAGNISRSLRAPATTLRVNDLLQLTFDSEVVAGGTVRQARP
jgi:hypothetical protein